jgi:4-hydroxy-tetrahydrodipicolinate reductase
MEAVRVAICGVHGRMGEELARGLAADPEILVVGGCDPRPREIPTPQAFTTTPDLASLLGATEADVVVDFTTAEAARANAATALERRAPIVIGTTGLTPPDLERIDNLARGAGVGAMVAPNFAIGAILLMQFAKLASRFLDAAEIVEIHHDAKIDAPSGTAIAIAQAMRSGRETPFSGDQVTKFVVEHTRGGVLEDVHIHSLRLPGFVATHQVTFGGPGQSLTIRHDSIGRDSFIPGVALAVKRIREHVGLVYGLDALLGL